MLRDSVAMLVIMMATAMMMMTIAVTVIMMVMVMEVCTCIRRLVSVPTSGSQLMPGLFDLKH